MEKSTTVPSSAMVPESGVSSPAMMRSSVLFPPPEGPMKTMARASPKYAVIPSSTVFPSKDLVSWLSCRRIVGGLLGWTHVDGLGKKFQAQCFRDSDGACVVRVRAVLHDPFARHRATGSGHGYEAA